MGEIYHLRSPLPPSLPVSFTPVILALFFPPFLFLFLYMRAATHCVTRVYFVYARGCTLSGRLLSLLPPSFLRMRDANGRLSRIPRHPRSRFARNYFSPCRDLFTNDAQRVKSSRRYREREIPRDATWERHLARSTLIHPPHAHKRLSVYAYPRWRRHALIRLFMSRDPYREFAGQSYPEIVSFIII